MSVLASRIEQLRRTPTPQPLRLFVLDAMVPGQRLELYDVPDPFIAQLRGSAASNIPLGVLGRHRLQLFSHGVGVEVESMVDATDASSGGASTVVLRATDLFVLCDEGADEGSRWLGREARVQWLPLEEDELDGEADQEEVVARSASLEPLVERWMSLVRSTGRERFPGQLQRVLDDLGPIPAAKRVSKRALWVAGLINPLPALGVALEIRPATLMAPSASERLSAVERGIKDSIGRLQLPGSPF